MKKIVKIVVAAFIIGIGLFLSTGCGVNPVDNSENNEKITNDARYIDDFEVSDDE